MSRWTASAVLRFLACCAPLTAALAMSPSAFGQGVVDLDEDDAYAPHRRVRLTDEEGTPTPGQMTEEAAQAKRRFDGNDWVDAALGLNRVHTGETGDDLGNREIAQYQLAIALYNLRFYHASLGIFREVASKPNHNKLKETVLWLARLAVQLPEPAGIPELLVQHRTERDSEHFSNPQQRSLYWQLNYLLGRAEYRSRSLENAVEDFGHVDKSSPYFAFARAMEGATWVRLGKATPALRAFDQAQAALVDKDDEDSVRVKAFAELSMGRVLYSSAIRGNGPADATVNGRALAAAVTHYDRVPLGEYRQDALVETAWAHYMAGDFSRSLGSLTAAKDPLFGALPRPEADRLEVLLSYATCRYDAASARIAESRTARAPHRKEIADLLQRMRDDDQPGKLLAWARKTRASGDVAPPLAAMIAGGRVRHYLDHLATIEAEQALLRKSPTPLRDSDVGLYITDELDLRWALGIATTEQVILEELETLAKEYRNHDAQLTRMADTIDARKPGAARTPGQLAGVFRPARDGDAIQWPFDGEYWTDEVDTYRAVVISKCSDR